MTVENNNELMIEAIELGKFYGDFAAAQGITFTVPRGQVCAFLGPNGAGKSTTMKMLTGFLAPCEGSARIAGFDVGEDRLKAAERLGYLPENGPLYSEMTPKTFLTYVGETRCLPKERLAERLDYVAKTCSLRDAWEKAIGKLSRGYRQRVGMAQALLHDPDVLILDEPTSGLDPNQVHGVRRLISSLGETKTVLLSTHILREVHAVCSRVLLINEGRLVFDGPTSELGTDDSAIEDKFRQLTFAA
ncbi:MAG: ATP-binding cassette domain-containing protein [Planctomycetales bacterium]|nr:ATP-binding cassette domain-containing protein [Planctomycetales bacterium]